MRVNENYTFEDAADKTLRLSVAFPVYRNVPVRGSKVSVGVGRRESIARSVTVKSFVKAYYKDNNRSTAAQRKFATEFKLKQINPSGLTIKNLIRKFERTRQSPLFHLDGFVNKQNGRICETVNPHFVIEKPLNPQRVTVWCAMSSHGTNNRRDIR
ncbi:hypothetical protein TNCV_1749471 [Trichonephila clavipes]|nr:hypothetical protein TNCV_1749471 [Trichonephila clavipes]